MPIHKSGRSVEMLAETVKLTRDFLADLGFRQLVSPRGLEHVTYLRQAPRGRESRHVSKRAAKREI